MMTAAANGRFCEDKVSMATSGISCHQRSLGRREIRGIGYLHKRVSALPKTRCKAHQERPYSLLQQPQIPTLLHRGSCLSLRLPSSGENLAARFLVKEKQRFDSLASAQGQFCRLLPSVENSMWRRRSAHQRQHCRSDSTLYSQSSSHWLSYC